MCIAKIAGPTAIMSLLVHCEHRFHVFPGLADIALSPGSRLLLVMRGHFQSYGYLALRVTDWLMCYGIMIGVKRPACAH